MVIEAWWFENRQRSEDILQPDWFTPRTHCGVYLELDKEEPLRLTVRAFSRSVDFEREVEIRGTESREDYDLLVKDRAVVLKIFADGVCGLPEQISVRVRIGERVYGKEIKCEYSCIRGRTTDFEGNPFPAAVVFERKAFGGKIPCIGTWSDRNGNYSVVVPNGRYGAFYVEDHSYKISTLENWSWKMVVDRDERQDFKIGTGEVYGLSVWESPGVSNALFLYFRPMILPQIKTEKFDVTLDHEKREVVDIQPDLEKEDLRICIDDREVRIFSVQRIYETGIYEEGDYSLIAYVVQAEKPVLSRGKHTAVVEYETSGKYRSQSQGRTHFFVVSVL